MIQAHKMTHHPYSAAAIPWATAIHPITTTPVATLSKRMMIERPRVPATVDARCNESRCAINEAAAAD